MIVGIVGHERRKFTAETEAKARAVIRAILAREGVTGAVSGGCHLGGVDIWAEEEAKKLGIPFTTHLPAVRAWSKPSRQNTQDYGYRARNIKIAETADELHVVVVAEYPPGWRGMTFVSCYHCHKNDHIKSGGCWTAKWAQKLGKPSHWHVIKTP